MTSDTRAMFQRVVVLAVCLAVLGCDREDQGPPTTGMTQAGHEAELAELRERLRRDGERSHPFAIINAHEHLMRPDHFVRYLGAARRLGVVRTVVVTSPEFTLFGKGDKSYASMAKNWIQLRAAVQRFPGEIVPFASVDPNDPEKLQHLKSMVDEGALGVKLYSGHSNLYEKPLDDDAMTPVYQYLEQTQLPVNWHINLSKYRDEFARVMKAHPKLNVMVPHYGVAFWRPKNAMGPLMELMRAYPNLYLDTSLGTREILIDGMYVMADHTELFQKLFEEFGDRIVYGSDSVITGNREKTTSWYYLVLAATRDHLESSSFVFPLAEGYSTYFKPDKRGHNAEGRVKGLALSDETLKKVYDDNARAWLTKYKPLPALPTK